MVEINTRLEINNFFKEQERNKHETISGSVKKKLVEFKKRKKKK
jgi:hypothetical protein